MTRPPWRACRRCKSKERVQPSQCRCHSEDKHYVDLGDRDIDFVNRNRCLESGYNSLRSLPEHVRPTTRIKRELATAKDTSVERRNWILSGR